MQNIEPLTKFMHRYCSRTAELAPPRMPLIAVNSVWQEACLAIDAVYIKLMRAGIQLRW
jgi:hypothetical protein